VINNYFIKRKGADDIRQLLKGLDSAVFSPEIFAATGFFVIRKAIPAKTILEWQSEWEKFYTSNYSSGRTVNKYNPVAFDDELPPILSAMHQNTSLLDIIEQAFGPDIALYNQRLVIKDSRSRGPVFLHHDSPYHLGWPIKASAFVAISPVTPENGGMIFYPGTHQFGFLGDAGEINPEILDPNWPTLSPSLDPGDVALMHSLTWHKSGPHLGGPDRIMADIIYQPANDPSGNALLRGKWQTDLFLNKTSLSNKKLFIRSRSSRLSEMQKQLDQLESK